MAITNSLNYFQAGENAVADEVLSNTSFVLNNMINFALDGATTTNQDNLKIDLFGADTAQYLEFMEYNAGTDLYECMDNTVTYYIIIEATSTDATSVGNVNIAQMSTGKWIVWASAGTYEVNRSEVLAYLFKPTAISTVTTARSIANFVSITAIKTDDSDDQGKRASYAYLNTTAAGFQVATKTGTFNAGGNAVSSWSSCNGSAANVSRWEIPSGTARNTEGGGATNDEFGDDLSADEVNSPADCQIEHNGSGAGAAITMAIILHESTISWATVLDGQTDNNDFDADFLVDHSIPAFTAVTESDLTCRITTDSTTVTTNENLAIVNSVNTLTAGNTIAYEISFDNGSNWLAATESVLTESTNTGTNFRVRMTITRATNTETDSITSYAAYYD